MRVPPIVSVYKRSDGTYSAVRSYTGQKAVLLEYPGTEEVFTITCGENESEEDCFARCRQEARRRGIQHVKHLDD